MFLGLLGIVGAIVLIIILTRRNWQLGWAMLAGSAVIALFSGLPPLVALRVFFGALTSPTTINLALIIAAITILGYLMQMTGSLQEIIKSLNRLVRDARVLMMVIPALVALLLIPGGAVFSAPMMEPLGKRLGMKPDSVSAANIVFRHLIYGIFPFYTSLLLIAEISRVDVYFFIRYNIPVLFFGFIFAFIYFFHGAPKGAARNIDSRVNLENISALLVSSLPFIIVLVLGVGFKVYFPLALLAGIICIILIGNPAAEKKGTAGERLAMVWPGIDWSMVLAIVGIMIFKDFVQASAALDDLSALLLDLGIPLLLLAVVFPMLTGMITGNNAAALGITVPLFLPLLPPGALGQAYLAIMFISGLMGYLPSPFHLCLVLSTQFLKGSLFQSIKEVMVPSMVIIAFALVPLLFY